jgi:acyl-CoA synthetase (AMP-forming)/AMP-acid ligase II
MLHLAGRSAASETGRMAEPATPSLADLIRDQAAAIGDDIAFTFEGRDLTYRELDLVSNRVANALLAAGVGRGDRIAFLDKNTLELFELVFGAAKVGAVVCPVNWRLAPAEIAHIVNDADAKVVVVGNDFFGVLDACEPDLTSSPLILAVGGHPRHPELGDWRDPHSDEDPQLETSPDDVVVQFYTSGTTGLPKGVMLTSTNLLALVPAVNELLGTDDDGIVSLVVMPLFHVAGAGWALFGLMVGVRNIMLRDVDLGAILEAIPKYGVTHSVFVPAVLQFLLMTPGVEDTDFSSLRMITYGASPISEKVLVASMERFGCDFAQAYGLTETSGGVVLLHPEDHDPGGPRAHRLRAAGRAVPGVELRIVAADGSSAPTGEIGEVWIRSPSTMTGYWNKPDATRDAITSDGWFRTGDAGRLDDDGYLYIEDRVKDMVITGGENVYPAEVESVLMSHPSVADAAVIGVPDDRWGETVKAIVVPAPGVTADANELIAWCRDRLASYKCPTSVDWAEMLPRNPSGKILKRELREPYWGDRERQVG